MKLYLTDIMGNLGAGELSHLSLFKDGWETLPFDRFNQKLLPILNAGLIDIHTRFFVKQKEIWMKHDHGCKLLTLDKKHSSAAFSLTGGKYILDCDEPFKDDVVEILSIFDEWGQQYPLNSDRGDTPINHEYTHSHGCGCGCQNTPTHFCSHDLQQRFRETLDYPATITTRHPYGSGAHTRTGLPGLFTPTMNSIRLPDGLRSGFMRVIYKAAPARIKPLDDNGVRTYENIQLDLPASYLNALVMYMAYRLTSPTNGGLQGQTNEPLAYYNKYLSACALLVDQGVDVATTASGEGRFDRSGFF